MSTGESLDSVAWPLSRPLPASRILHAGRLMRWSWLLIVFLLLLAVMLADKCHGCQKPFTNLPAHLSKCTKAHKFFGGGLR